MRLRLPHLLALGLAALAALPAPAGAVTFGADLSQPVATTATWVDSFGASSCRGYAVIHAVATIGVQPVTTKVTLKAPEEVAP